MKKSTGMMQLPFECLMRLVLCCPQLVYSFDEADLNPDVKTKFSLSSNGQLRTLMPLDREEKNKYMIPVHVTDGGK